MTKQQPTPRQIERAAQEAANGNGSTRRVPLESIDRAGELLTIADDANDVLYFWETDPISNKFKYLERVDVPDVRPFGLEEWCSSRYGGGKFKVAIRNRQSSTYGTSVIVDVSGPPKSRTDRDAVKGVPGGPVPASSSVSNSNHDWLKLLSPILAPIGVAFGTMLAKKLLEPKQTDPVLIELLKQLGKSNGANAPAASALDNVKLLESLLNLQDSLAERANGNAPPASTGDGSGGVAGVLERNIPSLVQVLNRKLDVDERRAIRGRAIVTTNNPAPAAAASSSSSSSSSAGDDVSSSGAAPAADALVALLQSVPNVARRFILGAAESDENPAVYADLILGKLDDASYAAIAGFLDRPDFVDVFVQTMPAFSEYRPWVEELAGAMRESIANAVTELSESDSGNEGRPHSVDASSSSGAP